MIGSQETEAEADMNVQTEADGGAEEEGEEGEEAAEEADEADDAEEEEEEEKETQEAQAREDEAAAPESAEGTGPQEDETD